MLEKDQQIIDTTHERTIKNMDHQTTNNTEEEVSPVKVDQTTNTSEGPKEGNGHQQPLEQDAGNEEEEELTRFQRIKNGLISFYWTNEFLVLVVVAILLARAYPPIGADYLQPQITATWIAVVFIFVMAGLSLKTEEFKKAFQRIGFNVFVQMFNFGLVSGLVYVVALLLVEVGVLKQALGDGMVVCACLPLTVNMVLVLTKSAGGDEASAIFNAAFGNMLGVFLSPVLILGYLGVQGDVDLVSVFYKLALRVLIPVVIGQILQKTSKTVVGFVKKHKKHFKAMQSYALVFIVYTVFCRTFSSDSSSTLGEIVLMIVFQGAMLCIVMGIAWVLLGILFRSEPTLRVMGLFGCSHKTVALGVPLINAIYEDNPNVGLYTLPLLVWHPMQLVLGSFLVPRLSEFVEREENRLGITDDVDEDEEKGGEQPTTPPVSADTPPPAPRTRNLRDFTDFMSMRGISKRGLPQEQKNSS